MSKRSEMTHSNPDLIRLDTVVRSIYYNTINTTDKNYYFYKVPLNDRFYKDNMNKILSNINSMLPCANVSHTLLALGSDGEYYDIANLDDKDLSKVDRALENSYIIVKW